MISWRPWANEIASKLKTYTRTRKRTGRKMPHFVLFLFVRACFSCLLYYIRRVRRLMIIISLKEFTFKPPLAEFEPIFLAHLRADWSWLITTDDESRLQLIPTPPPLLPYLCPKSGIPASATFGRFERWRSLLKSCLLEFAWCRRTVQGVYCRRRRSRT